MRGLLGQELQRGDEQSTKIVFKSKVTLNNLDLQDKTVINISHKTEQLSGYDRVILLENGQVVMEGGVDAVIEKYNALRKSVKNSFQH